MLPAYFLTVYLHKWVLVLFFYILAVCMNPENIEWREKYLVEKTRSSELTSTIAKLRRLIKKSQELVDKNKVAKSELLALVPLPCFSDVVQLCEEMLVESIYKIVERS